MTYRTEQDKINRKEANQRYYKLEENKQQKRDYMKEYSKRDYVKARAHEKYLKQKIKDNDTLNVENTERFIDGAQDKDLEQIYNDIFGDAVEYMRDYEVQAVAATYMAIAMRLYKTHLDDDEYKSMIQTVMETEVNPYKEPKVTLMTRFIKSSSAYSSDKVDCPERRLFVAVLSQAVHDAFAEHVPDLEKRQAQSWLMNNSEDFRDICEHAGKHSKYVLEKIRRKILEKNGWNVNVSLRTTPPRRRKQMRKINKKHLTGNAYYAAKREQLYNR